MSKRRKREMKTLLILVVITVLITANVVYAVGGRLDAQPRSFFEIGVYSGDTLWDIAETYKPSGGDIRNFIREIRRLNSLDSETIYPGQILIIPQ